MGLNLYTAPIPFTAILNRPGGLDGASSEQHRFPREYTNNNTLGRIRMATPVSSVEDAIIDKPPGSHREAIFTITLDRSFTNTVSVNHHRQQHRLAESDYRTATSGFEFKPGETSKTVIACQRAPGIRD
jgi:hypothetical protein